MSLIEGRFARHPACTAATPRAPPRRHRGLDSSRRSPPRPVERVSDLRALLAGDAVTDVGAAGLVVAEPGDRRHLQPRVASRRIHLDVEAAVVALAHVAGADLDDA